MSTATNHHAEPIDVMLPHERRRSDAAKAKIDAGIYDNDPRILNRSVAAAVAQIVMDQREDALTDIDLHDSNGKA